MVLGNKGVWDGSDNVIYYEMPYFLLFGSSESFFIFLRKLLKGSDVFHCTEMYIFLCYVIRVIGSRLDGNLLLVDGACVGSASGQENTIGKLKIDCGLRWSSM